MNTQKRINNRELYFIYCLRAVKNIVQDSLFHLKLYILFTKRILLFSSQFFRFILYNNTIFHRTPHTTIFRLKMKVLRIYCVAFFSITISFFNLFVCICLYAIFYVSVSFVFFLHIIFVFHICNFYEDENRIQQAFYDLITYMFNV